MQTKNCILTGNFNLNLLKHAKLPGVSNFLENLLSYKFMPQITRVTKKVATLIDNILINDNALNCHITFGNITTSISDHDNLPQFIALNSLFESSIDEGSSQTDSKIFFKAFTCYFKKRL